jgi:3-oxoacyl-[acyl-carrier protein] reductase
MNLDLTGRRALVCGSSQGLGLASAVELSLLGAEVILFARNEQRLRSALEKLNTSKQQSHKYIVADFIDPDNVRESLNSFLASNKEPIHILVNNSGGPKGGPALTASVDEYMQAFKSHLVVNQLLTQAVVPMMKSEGFGRIINIISTSVKQPIPDLGVSNTIRGAVANWAKTLASELGGYGITVNNVLPGFTKTSRYDSIIDSRKNATGKSEHEIEATIIATIPAGRIGTPEEFGAAVAFLCSPAAAYINGINFPVDGGRLSTL